MSIAAVGALCLLLLQSPSPDVVRRAVKAELATPGYQDALPGEAPAVNDASAPRTRSRRRVDLPSPPAGGALARVAGSLLWLLAAVTGLLILVWLLRGMLGAPPPPRVAVQPEPAERAAALRAVVARPLRDAEALAAQGRHGEAIHILLLRTLEALVERRGLYLPASLTSREVVAQVELPGDADAALRGLVAAVEVSHFGGVEPAEAEWQTCLTQFQRFARAFGAGA